MRIQNVLRNDLIAITSSKLPKQSIELVIDGLRETITAQQEEIKELKEEIGKLKMENEEYTQDTENLNLMLNLAEKIRSSKSRSTVPELNVIILNDAYSYTNIKSFCSTTGLSNLKMAGASLCGPGAAGI